MDQEFHVDVDEVRRRVGQADVIGLYFPYFGKTLLLDTRRSAFDEPLVRVVPMVASAQERLDAIARIRPRLGRPESLLLIPWPRFVASTKASGIWQILVERLCMADARAEVGMERCYRELLHEERAELRRAVLGQGYRSLWTR